MPRFGLSPHDRDWSTVQMDPLQHQVTVACDQESAFNLFTAGMGTWWDPVHTEDAATFTGIDLEPHVDGAVTMRHGADSYTFGRVLVWEPPSDYGQSFWLAMDPAHPSRIDAAFDGHDGVCTVRFAHGGWTAENEAAGARYSDWPHLLGRFAEAAARL